MNNWSINKKGYDPETHNHFAPVYTVGNGYMCCRGFMEEQREGVAGLGGIYMAGVFGRASYKPWKGEGQELVNLPNFFWVDIDIDGKPLVLSPENLRGYTETLDVKNAVFTRSYQYFLNGKPLAEFTFTRFLSRADIRIAGQQITVTPLADGLTVQLRLGTDPGVTNLNEVSSEPYPVQPGKKHWDILSRDAESLRVCVRGGEKTELAFVQRVTAEGVEVSPGEYAITARVNKPAGEPVTVQKLVSVYKSDTGSVPLPADGPLAKARAKMENAPGYSEVLSAHQKAMSAFWESADVRVEGDDETQISLRYNILQLEQSFPRHTSEVSIGARGLTGEMYEGSVFWDTEIFMLPFFTMTDPAAAKNLLMFRYHTLPEAREHAASNWFKGAMYGWQVNARGVEQTPQGAGAYYSVHIVADVAFAMLEYWNATADDKFILDYGLEILIETARFWASRVTKRESDGQYDIIAVRGPNEYDVLVNNNFYTNIMARENFLLCDRIFKAFSEKYPQELSALARRLNFETAEAQSWIEIADKIILPYEKERDLWLEDDAWLRRKPLDMAKAKPTSKRIIDTAVPYEALPFYQVTKQADVLHAMKNLPWHFTRKQIETAFDYYLPKTAFDSSLAYSMFALMAARLGRPETALAFFDKCINLDIRNVQLNTISGLHFANFGGSWQAAVFGFGGVEVLKDRLAVSPVLPDRWKKLSFRLRYKDALLGIEAAQGYTRVTLLSEGKGPVNIELAGQRFTLTRAGETALKLPDDLLILAPHPDDETIMTAGIIRRAVEQGSRVTVAVVTDGNYSKRGTLRRAESLEAMLALGLKEKDIHFLNYPDTGFEPEISFLYNLSGGEREDFVRNLTGLIEKVKPRLVITSSEWDTHGDHAALFALTREALQKSIVRPQLWQSLIHSPAGDDVWPKPNAPEEYFTAPPGFAEWDKRISIPLPEGFSKAGAIRMYPVAIDLREGPEPETEVTRYLLAFAKRDEIFWEADYEDLSC